MATEVIELRARGTKTKEDDYFLMDGALPEGELPIFKALKGDLKAAATLLEPGEVRWLVRYYYDQQEDRIRVAGRVRTLSHEPNLVIRTLLGERTITESRIKQAMDVYSDVHPTGSWMKSLYGFGPVISAGLLAYVNMDKAQTAGDIWRYAGLDPTIRWYGMAKATALVKEVIGSNTPSRGHVTTLSRITSWREEFILYYINFLTGSDKITKESLILAMSIRPWCAPLKLLCFKIGECINLFQAKSPYGPLLRERKEYEQKKNVAGDYRQQAESILSTKNIGKATDAYTYYSNGMLPPAHIQQRVERWTTKLFISHFHSVAWWNKYHTVPPMPVILTKPNHHDYHGIPNLDMVPGLEEAARKEGRKI